MRRIYAVCERLAGSDVPVLIEGEAGTGKELLAEVLHEKSSRSGGPFVVLDAALVPWSCVEGELFGDEASGQRGALASAAGGTLLIDQVSELPVAVQSRLARALASEPAGTGATRLITTSRSNLDEEVEAGRFREDLFFCLVPGRVEMPPLRAREDDVRLLAELFWKRQDPAGRPMPRDLLRRHGNPGWPGNVRELQAVVARRIALGPVDDEEADAAMMDRAPENAFQWLLVQELAFPAARALLLGEFERVFVELSLAKHGGNVSRAAAASGLARRYFQIIRARMRR
jgi:DNA-binding NtrC family response regulator